MDDIVSHRVSEQVDLNLREWLASYFDGGTHPVGPSGTGVTFPQAELGFGVSHLGHPVSGTCAITTIAEFDPQDVYLDGEGRVVCEDLRLSFVVRAKVGPNREGNSRWQCQQTEGLLNAILSNAESLRGLAQHGIYDLLPGTRRIVAATDYATREVTAKGRLEYSA